MKTLLSALPARKAGAAANALIAEELQSVRKGRSFILHAVFIHREKLSLALMFGTSFRPVELLFLVGVVGRSFLFRRGRKEVCIFHSSSQGFATAG